MTSPRRRWPRWLHWLRDLVVLLLLVWGVQWWQSRQLASGPAPQLSGYDLHADLRTLSAYRGKPVLVHFWATWCPVCRLEEGSIDRLADDFPVLTVATTSGSAQELRTYLKKQGLSFPVLVDESGALARSWRVQGVPVSYIVDSQGKIAWSGSGYSSELGLRARLYLAD